MSNRKKIKEARLRLKNQSRTQVLEAGLAKMALPENEAVVIKEVPAKVGDVEVGVAYIHDDGSVAIRYHEDLSSPEQIAAMEKIKATELEVGYSLEMGGPTDGAP